MMPLAEAIKVTMTISTAVMIMPTFATFPLNVRYCADFSSSSSNSSVDTSISGALLVFGSFQIKYEKSMLHCFTIAQY